MRPGAIQTLRSGFGGAILLVATALWPAAALGQAEGLVEAAERSRELYQQGQLLDALPFAEEAARISEVAFGPDNITIARTYNVAFAAMPDGEWLTWIGADGVTEGAVMPVATFAGADGRRCRLYRQRIAAGGRSDEAAGDVACVRPDGSWARQ